MYKTAYTKETYVIRDSRGRYLKEDSTNPDDPFFTDNDAYAHQWNRAKDAQDYAGRINERYTSCGITDVWGAPKKVLVCKMTVSTVVEPVPAPDPNQTKMDL